MTKLKPPLKWHGGKHYLADWIISLMPEHTRYVEPYFGGGSVLLRKDPEGVSEFANDLNGGLSNFWKTLASEQQFKTFQKTMESTPFAQAVFEANKERPIVLDDYCPDWRWAVAFFIRCRQSRQGLMKDYATPTKRTRRGMNENVSAWLTAVEGLPDIHARLKRVEIWNRPALEVIEKLDSPDTLFYLDPPYLHETRSTCTEYGECEMCRNDHAVLLAVLSRIEGKFLLSGYPSKMYEGAALEYGWHCHTREIDNKSSSAKTKEKKTECVWTNFEPVKP